MNTAVIMRNSKARTFLYVLLACAMMFTVFLLSSTHTKLKETQESHEKCQQQRDSLSAQLQVVYEHKSRLEKTLQTETLERKKADEALQLSRDEWERDKKGVQSKADQLERKLEEMDKSHQEEFGNLKSSYNSLQQEKEKLEADLARHVVLLQQERDAHVSLNREIAELRDLKLKGDVALDTEVKKMRSQLETCHSEQNLLQAAIQQLKSVQRPGIAPQIPDTEKLQDHAASNVQSAQVVGSAEVGAVLPKSEAKKDMAEGGHVPADPNTRCTVGFSDALDWKPLSFLDASIAQKACALCGTVSRKSVKLPCAHLLCADCHSESAQQGSVCPLDRKDFDERDLDRLELPDLDNYRVTCCNARNGCEFVGPASSFPGHYKQCAFHIVSCQRCHTAMLRTAVVSHCRDGCSGAPAAPAAPQRRSSRSRDSAEQRHDDLKATLQDISRGMARMHDSVDQVSADVRRVDCRVEWWWKNNCADMRNFKSSVTKGFADEQKIIENVSSDVVAAVRGARWSLAEHVTQELGTQTKKVLSAVEAVSDNLDRFCGPPVYHWYLNGWLSLRLRAMGGSVAISSSPKWTAYGYCVSMYVSFVKDEHKQLRVTCFFNVHPGDNDPHLEWPFSKVFEYGIIHPTNRSLTIGHKTDPKFHKGNFCFQRPKEERSGGFAQQALSTAEKLEREEFVVDDMVHMFLVVIP